TMQLNYFGSLRLIMGFMPKMTERRKGHIINISSIGVLANSPRFSAYVASKAALDAWSRCAQGELSGKGISFTTINMPLVKTPMLTNSAGAFGDSAYQGFDDVTALVRAAGNGAYTVANVQTTPRALGSGGSSWGGWALVVAYRDPAQTATRNLNIYDGLLSASDASVPVDIAFSGFVTPASGPVNTTLGLLGW
ncbi:SDR family NAD(P)-dependent oxidoreductase, partial [Lysobacter sp. 2RAB21]